VAIGNLLDNDIQRGILRGDLLPESLGEREGYWRRRARSRKGAAVERPLDVRSLPAVVFPKISRA
jgi:hypothetical protein